MVARFIPARTGEWLRARQRYATADRRSLSRQVAVLWALALLFASLALLDASASAAPLRSGSTATGSTLPPVIPSHTTPVTSPANPSPTAPRASVAPSSTVSPVPRTAYQTPAQPQVPRSYAPPTLGNYTNNNTNANNSGSSTTSPTSTTTTTLAPLPKVVAPPPLTVPLSTKAPSAHVDPVFADLSGIGFGLALLLLIAQYILTRPGRRGRTL
ncbi:MAG: hypothetical protein ACYC1D_14315 [Acidimicrobiales bacterium]